MRILVIEDDAHKLREVAAFVVGLGGGRILTLESQKLILKSEKDAEREAKISLAEALKAALKTQENDL